MKYTWAQDSIFHIISRENRKFSSSKKLLYWQRISPIPMPILHFKGKSIIQNHHHTVKFHELDPVPSKSTSKSPSLDDNLVIHGDNLVALKALLPTYAGKVKCIYIDPPYNTGGEGWVYNDNVNSPMIHKWLGEEVGREDLTRHDKWCCMMYPRLTILKELLSEDGIIFVSIDENEVHRLRMIMEEIFEEENFLGELVWKNKHGGGGDNPYLVREHEYVMFFSKNITKLPPLFCSPPPTYESMFRHSDDKGKYCLERLDKKGIDNNRPNLIYPIECPDGTMKDISPEIWRLSEKEFRRRQTLGDIEFKKDKNKVWQIYTKSYLFNENGERRRVKTRSILRQEIVGFTQNGNKEIIEIFGNKVFPNPKPTTLLNFLLDIILKPEDIVLDSFAGSGTTAHAVLDLNNKDNGNRKFILIECEDYANKITAERIRRVSKGVLGAKDERLKKGLGGTFSFYELGKAIDIDQLLEGKHLPSYENLANYAFFTATGETFNPKNMEEKNFYIGSTNSEEVFLLYAPEAQKLREMALNLEFAETITKKFPNRPKLVFAPACYLEEFDLRERNIRFAQLPFEIYRLAN